MKENQRVTITKRMLREGLLRLLETKALDKIRVNELCAEAGINRATFYRHYGTPQDILSELETEFIQQAYPVTDCPKNLNDAYQMLENTCQYLYSHSDIARVLILNNNEEKMQKKFEEVYRQLLKTLKNNEKFANTDENTIRTIVAFICGGGYSVLRQWILGEIPKAPGEIAGILFHIICGTPPKELF